MCGSNQKIDLGELLSERRMKSQIRGNDPDSCGACTASASRQSKSQKKKGGYTYEATSPVRSEELEERITPGLSGSGHPAQTAGPE